MTTLEKIKDIIHTTSWFQYEEDVTETEMSFATRDHGNVGDGTPGNLDVWEAEKLKRVLEREFPVELEMEIVDEWVMVNVKLKQ